MVSLTLIFRVSKPIACMIRTFELVELINLKSPNSLVIAELLVLLQLIIAPTTTVVSFVFETSITFPLI